MKEMSITRRVALTIAEINKKKITSDRITKICHKYNVREEYIRKVACWEILYLK